jgi:hypothetical protein
MARCDLAQVRRNALADLQSPWTPVIKPTGRQVWPAEIRQCARNGGECIKRHARTRRRLQERNTIGMPRLERLGGGDLDDLAGMHHGDTLTALAR